jgi:DNA-binding transcriptional LysR family regulator
MDRLDTVAIFVAVAEHANFAAVARKLSLPPGAVSRAIVQLEARLRTRLLNRTTRSVALTEAGMLYLERARGLLAANVEFEDGTHHDLDPSGMLRITAPANFGRQHLMPLLHQFLEKHALIDARVVLLDRVVSLVDEGLDVGVRIGQLPDSTLRATRVGTLKQAIYASPFYIDRHGMPVALSELAKHRTIASGTHNQVSGRWRVGGKAGAAHVTLKPRLVVSTTEAAADIAAAGFGLVSLLSYQAAQHVAAGRLVEVLSKYSVSEIPINIIQPAGRFTPAKVRAFIEEIGLGLRRQFG